MSEEQRERPDDLSQRIFAAKTAPFVRDNRFMRLVEAARAMVKKEPVNRGGTCLYCSLLHEHEYVCPWVKLAQALSDMEQAGDIPAADNPPPRG